MTHTAEAIYTGGVFRPVQPVAGLAENSVVTVQFADRLETQSHPFAGWVGDMPDEDAAEILRVVHEEFGQVDPADWK